MLRNPALLVCAWAAAAVSLPTASAGADAESEAIAALNDVRRAQGVPALQVSESLSRSSDRYARRMIRRDFFAHAGGVGGGETIAWHSGWAAQARRTVARWMASPGHRAVLLSPAFRRVGMGMARGRLGSRVATMWVARVASP